MANIIFSKIYTKEEMIQNCWSLCGRRCYDCRDCNFYNVIGSTKYEYTETICDNGKLLNEWNEVELTFDKLYEIANAREDWECIPIHPEIVTFENDVRYAAMLETDCFIGYTEGMHIAEYAKTKIDKLGILDAIKFAKDITKQIVSEKNDQGLKWIDNFDVVKYISGA